MGARLSPSFGVMVVSVYFDTLLGLIKVYLCGYSVNWFRWVKMWATDCCGTGLSPHFLVGWSRMA